jgi:circadian clock protein KaiB
MTAAGPATAAYRLLLMVAGSTPRSRRAIANLRRVCDEHLADDVDLDIIDIRQRPELARQYQVVAVPTLVKLLPPPARQIVGDLSARDRLLEGLDLTPAPAG